MTWLVAVDPGIDATGVACFDLLIDGLPHWEFGRRTRPESFPVALSRLGPTTVIRTKPAEDLVARLATIAHRFGEFTEQASLIDTILLERPAMPGAYKGDRQNRQRTKGMINGAAMEKLYLTLGVLLDSSISNSELRLGGRVELVVASRVKKEVRQRVVIAELQRLRHPLVAQGAPRSPDLLDAIYLGAAWLSDPRRLADIPPDASVHGAQA